MGQVPCISRSMYYAVIIIHSGYNKQKWTYFCVKWQSFTASVRLSCGPWRQQRSCERRQFLLLSAPLCDRVSGSEDGLFFRSRQDCLNTPPPPPTLHVSLSNSGGPGRGKTPFLSFKKAKEKTRRGNPVRCGGVNLLLMNNRVAEGCCVQCCGVCWESFPIKWIISANAWPLCLYLTKTLSS